MKRYYVTLREKTANRFTDFLKVIKEETGVTFAATQQAAIQVALDHPEEIKKKLADTLTD